MTTVVCPCGRPVHMKGRAAKCKCGRTLTVGLREPFKRRRKTKGSLKRRAGQVLRQLQGLLMGAGFVLLVVTAVALISMAGR